MCVERLLRISTTPPGPAAPFERKHDDGGVAWAVAVAGDTAGGGTDGGTTSAALAWAGAREHALDQHAPARSARARERASCEYERERTLARKQPREECFARARSVLQQDARLKCERAGRPWVRGGVRYSAVARAPLPHCPSAHALVPAWCVVAACSAHPCVPAWKAPAADPPGLWGLSRWLIPRGALFVAGLSQSPSGTSPPPLLHVPSPRFPGRGPG